nr:uncharacterized protein LOC129259117 [Lytechinus pictus]
MTSQSGEEPSRVGKFCTELNIDTEILEKGLSGVAEGWVKLNHLRLVRGVVGELDKWCRDHKYSVNVLPNLIATLFDVGDVDTDNKAVKVRVQRAVDAVRKAQKARGKSRDENLEVIERTLFTLPHTSREQRQIVDVALHAEAGEGDVPPIPDRELVEIRAERDSLRDSLDSIRLEKDQKFRELCNSKQKLTSEIARTRVLKTCLKRNAKKIKDLETKLDTLVRQKIKAQNRKRRNARARAKRKQGVLKQRVVDQSVVGQNVMGQLEASLRAELKTYKANLKAAREEIKEMKKNVGEVEAKYRERVELNKLLEQKRVTERNRILSRNRYDRKVGRKRARDKIQKEREQERLALKKSREETRGLKKRIREQNLFTLEEESPKKRLKAGKQYNANIRSVYLDLLNNYGVSTRNCEGVVKTVLENLTSMEIPDLPKKSTAQNLLLEGRKMAQIQVAESLAHSDLTLGSDATSKFGHHYTSFDVFEGEGGSGLIVGMRETDDGTADTTMQTLKTILQDVVGQQDEEAQNQAVNTVLANIKNTMSDRHIVQKKFNELLKDYRQSILPSIIQGWKGMSEGERDQFASMNNFFCGLHYLVGLAEYAGKTLGAWEGMIFKDKEVGAAASSESGNSTESGTERLIRTVCKSVQDRACEKSGKPLQFRTFLKSKGISTVPLAPFKGNRFNILFHNAAGVAYLLPELLEFFDKHKDDNELMKGVHADLVIKQFIAGARALGLIDKVVTGPLWRTINEKGHIADMNDRYRVIHQGFSRWSDDSSQFMRGKDILFDDIDIKKDEIYHSLVQVNPELDEMTKQILELVFLTFCQVTEKMLADHLPSGSHTAMNEKKKRETASVPKTNVGVERDFGMLDRLMRLKPAASTMVYEGVIMNVRNRTREWRKGLTEMKREEYMEYSRKSVKAQREEYARRVKTLWANREAKRKSKKQIAQEREDRNKVRTEKVYASVRSKCGGIWLSETELNSQLEGVDDKHAIEMLQSQLQARRHVFGEKNVEGNLNISVKGRRKSLSELKQSLRSVLKTANDRIINVEEQEEVDYTNAVAPTEKVEEFREKTREKMAKEKARAVKGKDLEYDNLVGKIVEHLTSSEDGSEEGWYRAIVTGKSKRGLSLSYDINPQTIITHPKRDIEQDLENGDLKIVDLNVEDVVGMDVMHQFEVGDERIWYRGFISSVTGPSECLIEYDYLEDENDEDSDIIDNTWVGPVLEHYRNNYLRFVRA